MTQPSSFDLLIIGGGINGVGIARDAAGRGFSACVAEMNDLASGTSSWSTKLVHGGLRYLEHYEFRLVREALIEREVLWRSAPHLIEPLRFVLPHHKGLRPWWLLRLGLFMYDNLGGRKLLPSTKTLDLRSHPTGVPLQEVFKRGFEYSDCRIDDTRMVVALAQDAVNHGAEINVQTKVVSARRIGELWEAELEDQRTGMRRTVTARMLINAAGPWVDEVLGKALGSNDAQNIRMVQGSHIVVNKLFDHDRCYIFQNEDDRIIFAIPYRDGEYTLIGTTDQDYEGDPGAVAITPQEITYLCEAASEYFKNPITKDQVVWTYSGVRPLYDDGASKAQEATRDYVLREDNEDGAAPLVNVFGGKITTYRKLAESMLELVEQHLGARGKPWTKTAGLPGGDFPPDGRDALIAKAQQRYPFLMAENAERLVGTYGTRLFEILGDAKTPEDLGEAIVAGITAREVTYLAQQEWATSADDILWRRSKIGVGLSVAELEAAKATITHYLS